MEPKKEATTGHGEWHGPCPKCGGTDRFRLQPNNAGARCVGFYACRQCKRPDGKDFAGDTISFCIDVMGLSHEEAHRRANAIVKERSFIKAPKKPSFSPVSLTPPNHQWQEKARLLVNWTHEQIMEYPDVLAWLDQRGLPIEAVKRHRIGYNPKYIERKYEDWGLPVETQEDGTVKPLRIAQGIVVPTREPTGQVIRIKIRCSDWTPKSKFSKYKALPGSMNGLNIIGNPNNPVMAVVESELDAFAIEYACQDFAFVVAVGSNTKNPDNVSDYLARRKILLICRDNDDAGMTMFHKWRKLYMHASDYPTPFGKDIGEFIQQGHDVRKWLLEAVPVINLN